MRGFKEGLIGIQNSNKNLLTTIIILCRILFHPLRLCLTDVLIFWSTNLVTLV